MSLYDKQSSELEESIEEENPKTKGNKVKKVLLYTSIGLVSFFIFFAVFFPIREIAFLKIEELNTAQTKIKMDDLKVSYFGAIRMLMPRLSFVDTEYSDEQSYNNYIGANVVKINASYLKLLLSKHLDASFEIQSPEAQFKYVKLSDGKIKGVIDWKNLDNDKKWLAVAKIKLDELSLDTAPDTTMPLPIKMVPISISGDLSIQVVQNELRIRQVKLVTDIGEIDVTGKMTLGRTPEFDFKFQIRLSEFFFTKFELAKTFLEANQFLLDNNIVRADLRGNANKPSFTFEKKQGASN